MQINLLGPGGSELGRQRMRGSRALQGCLPLKLLSVHMSIKNQEMLSIHRLGLVLILSNKATSFTICIPGRLVLVSAMQKAV